MRHLAWTALALFGGLALAPPPATGAEGRMARRPDRVGDSFVEDSELHMEISVTATVGGHEIMRQSLSSTETTRGRSVVLDAAGGRASRVRVTYDVARQAACSNGAAEQEAASPIQGRTYLVAREGGALVVADPEGKPVPGPEAEAVRGRNGGLGGPAPFQDVLAGMDFPPGERVVLPDAVARGVLDVYEEDAAVSDFGLVRTGSRREEGREIALFDASVRMSMRDPAGFGLDIDLLGKMEVYADDVRFGSIRMAGPVTVSGEAGQDGMTIRVEGSGSARLHHQRRPDGAPPSRIAR
ncbi:hypothetical protein L6R50_05435 [Myxococcota bacterium]|nr:hypothetical protein [Myxococcota bacterium]